MPRKGRKYQNDEKVLDRLKIPINIIKCKKPESDQTGREAAARGGISDETPSSGQSPKKK